MAAQWPAWAKVQAGGNRRGRDNDVDRTPLEDGLQRQAKRYRGALRTLDIVVLLADDDELERFEEWAEAFAHTWFAWSSPVTGAVSQAKVRGGFGAIETISAVANGRRRWEARLTLEGKAL